MLFLLAQRRPHAGIEIEVEAGNDDAALRGLGHGGQDGCGGGGRPGRTGRDDRPGRRVLFPALGQEPQQDGASLGRVHQTQFGQPLRPGLDRQGQEVRRSPPVLGQVRIDQIADPGQVLDLFDLAGIEEAGERIGQLQRPQGPQVVVVLILAAKFACDHPRHLEPAGQGGDGGRQVKPELARRERLFVLLQIP